MLVSNSSSAPSLDAISVAPVVLADQHERLLHMLRQLRRNHFGRKYERLSDEQLNLGLEDLETTIASGEAAAKNNTTLKASRIGQLRVSRGHLPAHLPRQEIIIDPPSRGVEHATRHLAGFSGTLQDDAHVAYKQLSDAKRVGGPLVLANCWGHFRREFCDIANAPLATEILRRIAALYAIEEEIRERTTDERQTVRQARTQPLAQALELCLKVQIARISQGSTFAKAIRYGLNHWQGLCRFLDDGRVEMDFNTVERSIRPVALSRKNALLAAATMEQNTGPASPC